MSAPYISVDLSKRLGQSLRNCVDQLTRGYDSARDLIAIMNQCKDNGNYDKLEAVFGLTNNGSHDDGTLNGTASVGYSVWYQLSAVFNLLDGSSAFKQFLAQLG